MTVALIDGKAVGLVRQRPAAPHPLAVRIDGLTVAGVLGLVAVYIPTSAYEARGWRNHDKP